MTFEFKEQSIGIQMDSTNLDDILNVTLENRVNHLADEMMRSMNIGLYGDTLPIKQLTSWEKFSRRIGIYQNRIRDAWLVLTGRADLNDWY